MDTFPNVYNRVVRAQGITANLLLANGFSIAANSCFNYGTILSKSDFSSGNEWIRNIFTEYNTNNFEFILEVLSHAKTISKCAGYSDISKKYENARKQLITIFINTLRRIHPWSQEITGNQNENNKSFLNNFNQIFTINYDLLLYKSINHNELTDKFKDGFRRQDGTCFFDEDYDKTNIWFLHGALHLRSHIDGRVYKITYRGDTGETILEQLRDDVQNGKYPLMVFEGTTEEKQKKINSSQYLMIAHNTFSKISGALFVCGFSFNDNDTHILEKIKKSSITNLCVGIYGDIDSDANNKIKEKCILIDNAIREKRSNFSIDYFDVTSANMW